MPNEPVVMEIQAFGKQWQVVLPPPDSYTKCSRARWTEIEDFR